MAETDEKTPAEEFDQERAARLIENLRADKAALKRERDEARASLAAAEKERDDAVSAKTTAEKELAADRRASVLREFEIDEDDAEEFLPDGLGLDELRRKAERLSKRGAKKQDEPKGEPKDEPKDEDKAPQAGAETPAAEPFPGRPKPSLTPGHGTGSAGDEPDLDALAASLRRR